VQPPQVPEPAATEVVCQAAQDAVGPEPALITRIGDVDQPNVVRREEAVLQRRVDVRGQRRTNTGQTLVSEHRVGVVQEATIVVECELRLDASHADTAADEALNAVIVTEVEQAVQHEAERRGRSAGIVEAASGRRAETAVRGKGRRRDRRTEAVHRRLAIAGLGLDPEHAEIVTDDATNVIAIVVIDRSRIVDGPDVEVHVLDDHAAAFDANVPRLITGQRGRGESSRCERQYNGKLPHINPLS
jgi:hypothetical protein